MDNPAYKSEEDSNGHIVAKEKYINNADAINPTLNFKDESLKLSTTGLYYSIDDEPPWYLSLALGFQHYLTMAGSTVSVPFILCPAMCMLSNDIGRAEIISTLMFISGVVTLFQTTLGTRLPIVQGGSFSFMAPALAILSLPEWQCPSDTELQNMNQEQRTEIWQQRMREIQGAIIVASLVEVFLGFFGIVGLILKYITPLTVAPAITMISLSLFKVSAKHASSNWLIALLTIVLIILFSQYLKSIKVPLPFTKSKVTGQLQTFPLFEVFPVLLTIGIVWALCAFLTATDILGVKDAARTDIKLNIIQQTRWFIFPYPFQWGWPTVSAGAVLGMISGVIAGMVESIGDYYACARISGALPPPKHALNRGIFMEGVGCVLAGIFGTGNGTTSYSENIGAIGVTKVGSRRVIQAAGVLMVVFSLIGKFGAVFVSIPEPIIGGIFCIVFATVVAVGLSNLQGVDLNSSRNIFIIGFSLFFGLSISQWVEENKGVISVGVESLDQIIHILLSTGMFVSGFLGFLFDNTIAGTDEERGLVTWSAHLKPLTDDGDEEVTPVVTKSYDLPFGMDLINRTPWMKRLPISPTFDGFLRRSSKLPIVVNNSNGDCR